MYCQLLRTLSILAPITAAFLLQATLLSDAQSAEPSTAYVAAATRLPESANTRTSAAADAEDQRVTALIQRALLNNESLSPLARNVVVSSNPQAVVLRGAVKAADVERIESLAMQFAGTRLVQSQLTVTGE